MLSTAAWNAFLKTLEEPPPNTVFVLATTEAQKVPATVVDRCHRFDFQRPTVEQIASVVRRAAQAEGSRSPPRPSPRSRARQRAASATRSARSSSSSPTAARRSRSRTCWRCSGSPTRSCRRGDRRGRGGRRPRGAAAVAGCVEQGRDAGAFVADLEVRARELLVVRTLGEVPAELSLTPELDAALQSAGASASRRACSCACSSRSGRARGDARRRRPAHAPGAGAGEGRQARPSTPRRRRCSPASSAWSAGACRQRPPSAGPSVLAGRSGPRDRARARAGVRPARSRVSAVGGAHDRASGAAGGRPRASAPTCGMLRRPSEPRRRGRSSRRSERRAAQRSPGRADRAAAARPRVAARCGRRSWSWCAPSNALLRALIEDARPVGIDGQELTVAFAASAPFLKRKAEDPANRASSIAALRRLTGGGWRISFELRSELDAPAERPGPRLPPRRSGSGA